MAAEQGSHANTRGDEAANYSPQDSMTRLAAEGRTRRMTEGTMAGVSWFGNESEIIPNLYIGDLQDAASFRGMIISVLPERFHEEPQHAILIPFLGNGRATLDTTAALIDAALALGLPVLVHCEEGCERAPLTVAWFLTRRRGMTLNQAYDLLQNRRPIIRDRRRWLGIYAHG